MSQIMQHIGLSTQGTVYKKGALCTSPEKFSLLWLIGLELKRHKW